MKTIHTNYLPSQAKVMCLKRLDFYLTVSWEAEKNRRFFYHANREIFQLCFLFQD